MKNALTGFHITCGVSTYSQQWYGTDIPVILWMDSVASTKYIWLDTECVQSKTLQWRHNGCDSVSNHQPHDCLPNRLFRRRSKKTSKHCVTGLCVGNSPGTGEFPAQMDSYAENVLIWWRHHETCMGKRTLNQEKTQYIACGYFEYIG